MQDKNFTRDAIRSFTDNKLLMAYCIHAIPVLEQTFTFVIVKKMKSGPMVRRP
jgi:hypothetical protein